MAQNENDENNNQRNKPPATPMTRQRSRSGSPVSRGKLSHFPNLLQTLREYDKNDDGYMNWTEFCEMCRTKNIADDARDQYWLKFGGIPNNNDSKISLEQIAQQTPKKFVREKGKYLNDEHSMDSINQSIPESMNDDDESSIYEQTKSRQEIVNRDVTHHIPVSFSARRFHTSTIDVLEKKMNKRSKTEASTSATTMLMEEPLRLFERYDLEEDGTLNIAQFEQMIDAIYPNNDDNDDNEIKAAFLLIDSDKCSYFNYREDVHDLEVKFRRFGGEIPNKQEFIKLCVNVFGNDEQWSPESNDDPIQFVENIIAQFTESIKSERKHLYSTAKMTVEELCSWIEKYGIPNCRDNKALRTENERLRDDNSSKQKQLKDKDNVEKYYSQYESELVESNKKLNEELHTEKDQHRHLSQKYTGLTNDCQDLERQLDKMQKDLFKTKQIEEKLKKNTKELKEWKHRYHSTQKQLDFLSKTHESYVNRLENEKEKLELLNNNYVLAATHGMAATIPDTDDEEFQNDIDSADEYNPNRRNSEDSIRKIHSIIPRSRSIADSEQNAIFFDNYDDNDIYHPQDIPMTQQIKQILKEETQEINNCLAQNNEELIHKIKEEWVDIVHKLKDDESIKSFDEIRSHLKEKEMEQRESLGRIKNTVQHTLVSIEEQQNNIKQCIKNKDGEIESLKKELAKYKHNDIKSIEMTLNELSDHNKEIRVDLQNMQQSLCVKAKLSTEAIESAQDMIQNTQIEAEINNATQFSSLGQNIYSMKKQLNHIFDKYNDDDDDDDVKSITSQPTHYSTLKQQIDDEMNIIKMMNESKQEIMEYIDLKVSRNEALKQIELLEKEHKEQKEYEDELQEDDEVIISSHSELLSLSQSIKDTELVNSISMEIKKEMEKAMNANRTLIGLDISQNMRFINDEMVSKLQLLQHKIENKSKTEFNDDLDASIKLYIKNVDDSHHKEMQKLFEERNETLRRERVIAQKYWLQQLSIMDNKLYNAIIDKNESNDDDKKECYDDDNYKEYEYETSKSFIEESPSSSFVDIANVESNVDWKYAVCTLFTALTANLLCIVLYFIHKGYHTPL